MTFVPNRILNKWGRLRKGCLGLYFTLRENLGIPPEINETNPAYMRFLLERSIKYVQRSRRHLAKPKAIGSYFSQHTGLTSYTPKDNQSKSSS